MKVSDGQEVMALIKVSDFAEGRVVRGKAVGSPDGIENGLWLCDKMGRNG